MGKRNSAWSEWEACREDGGSFQSWGRNNVHRIPGIHAPVSHRSMQVQVFVCFCVWAVRLNLPNDGQCDSSGGRKSLHTSCYPFQDLLLLPCDTQACPSLPGIGQVIDQIQTYLLLLSSQKVIEYLISFRWPGLGGRQAYTLVGPSHVGSLWFHRPYKK